MNEEELIFIDCSMGEGGGSIFRIAVALSCLFQKPVHMEKIRSNRNNPGLRLQHLLGAKALKDLTGGETSHMEVGSTEVKFYPGKDWDNSISIDVRTAGNIGLLTQTIQNALLLAPTKKYEIFINGGGTYGKWAPGTAFLNNITFKIFELMGYSVKIKVKRHGFYPKGGAIAKLIIEPQEKKKYKSIRLLKKGTLTSIQGEIFVENRLKKPNVGERIKKTVIETVKPKYRDDINTNIDITYLKSPSVGVGADVWVNYDNGLGNGGLSLGAGTFVGEKGLPSETLGRRIGRNVNLLLESPETVDRFASDQILPILFALNERSHFIVKEKTSHFQTNLNLLQNFYDRAYSIEKIESGGFKVSI